MTTTTEVRSARVALVGTPNCGKTALFNGLTGSRQKVANYPGVTVERKTGVLNTPSGHTLRLIDLPGYGYAKAPKEQVDAWHDLIFDYLRGRPNLHLVVMLIDSRHGIKDRDREVMGTLKKAAVPFLLVLTKCDLVRERELAQGRAAMETELRKTVGALPAVLATSSRKLAGIDALRAVLAGYALAERPEA